MPMRLVANDLHDGAFGPPHGRRLPRSIERSLSPTSLSVTGACFCREIDSEPPLFLGIFVYDQSPQQSIKAFMRNPAFPLSVQTALVEDLTRVSEVPGSIDIVALPSTAESEDQARFLGSCLDMLANYQQTRTPLIKIIAHGTVIGRDRGGVIIVPAEVNSVSWTKRASYFANRPDLASPKRSAWLFGQMSPLAKKNFEALGWVIYERTKL